MVIIKGNLSLDLTNIKNPSIFGHFFPFSYTNIIRKATESNIINSL
jgi:hypothetical protein